MARTYSLFPKHYNLVRDNPNLFLLHCYYYDDLDTLFILYKRYDTGEKILDRIPNPEVPVWISKQRPNRHVDFMKASMCDRVMVSYKNKTQEIKQELFDAKWLRYKDQYGFKVNRMVFPEVTGKTVALHPSLRFFDVPIEEIVYMEYCMNRYVKQGELEYEKVDIPHLQFSAFDIETYKDDTGLWHVHTNTFVDQDSGDSYIDILEDFEHFPRQQYLLEHQEEFEQEFKQTLIQRLQNIDRDESSKTTILNACLPIIEKLHIKIRGHKTEKDLIDVVTKTMYTDYSPDINMAFNISYDKKHLYKRALELGLPEGTMNQRGIGFDEIKPPFYAELDQEYNFKRDVVIPKKRCIKVNNISHTVDACYQTAYYTQRQGNTYASYSLEATATEILGIGKYDFSHICNSIVRLPFHDYWVHCLYSLMDSVLLLLCNAVSPEFKSKLGYCLATKTNLEHAALSSKAITRCVHTEAIVHGYIPSVNISQILARMSKEEVQTASKLLEIDLMKNYNDLIYRKKYGGGLVANPNKFQITQNLVERYHLLQNEAYLTMFRKVINGLYMDYKSHYPNANITRNVSKDTLVGRIVSVEDVITGEIYHSTEPKFKQYEKYSPHLGKINLALSNRDIISYGNITMGLPSMGELTLLNHQYDYEPKFQPTTYPSIRFLVPDGYQKLVSLLMSINSIKTIATDTVAFHKDNKHFFFNNGMATWDGTLIQYEYRGANFLTLAGIESNGVSYYGTAVKGEMLSQNENINIPKAEPFVFPSSVREYRIPPSFWESLEDTEIFTKTFKLAPNTEDELEMIGAIYCFYYPYAKVLKKLRTKKENGKEPAISDATIKIWKLQETAKCELRYTIAWKEIHLTIRHQFQAILPPRKENT